MKKWIGIVLSVALLLSLSGCGKDQPMETTADPTSTEITAPTTVPPSSETEAPRETVSLQIGIWDEYLDYDTNALTLWLEEQCDCDLSFLLYHEAEYAEPQTPANTVLPDIVYRTSYKPETVKPYVEDGYVLDLTEYFNDREGASKIFWDRIESELTRDQQDYVIQSMTDLETGRIYGVPNVWIFKRDHRPWINQVWLDELGLEMPTNAQELYDVLVAFQKSIPDGDSGTPLVGSQKAGGTAHVIDWLINLFIYYDPDNPWQDYDRDGQLEPVYTQEAYRDALKYISKLEEERLLYSGSYMFSNADLQSLLSLEKETLRCGIFLGDPAIHMEEGCENLYDYAPLPLWGNAVDESIYASGYTLISGKCENPDRAFELLMTLWSQEGALRVAYGEYGKNWDYADPGALDIWGMDAAVKELEPLGETHNAHWKVYASGMYYFIDGGIPAPRQQVTDDPWKQHAAEMNREANLAFAQAAKNNDFQTCGPYFQFTREEEERTWKLEPAVTKVAEDYKKTIATGWVRIDINNGYEVDAFDDTLWADYVQELYEAGLEEWGAICQAAYER